MFFPKPPLISKSVTIVFRQDNSILTVNGVKFVDTTKKIWQLTCWWLIQTITAVFCFGVIRLSLGFQDFKRQLLCPTKPGIDTSNTKHYFQLITMEISFMNEHLHIFIVNMTMNLPTMYMVSCFWFNSYVPQTYL